jgi:prevent-host-death family protein
MQLSLLPSNRYVTGAVFNRNPSDVKRKLADGPIVVTDRGEPSFVLVNAEDFERYYQNAMSAGDALGDPSGRDEAFILDRADLKLRETEF